LATSRGDYIALQPAKKRRVFWQCWLALPQTFDGNHADVDMMAVIPVNNLSVNPDMRYRPDGRAGGNDRRQYCRDFGGPGLSKAARDRV
jgi:hypothetical protein